MIKYSKDGMCIYDSETHTYKIGSRKLQGVTGFISKYKNKFDAELVAENYVKKNGGDVKDLLAKWKLEGEISCTNGTNVHTIFETYITTGEVILTGTPKELVAEKFIKDYFLTGKLMAVECEIVVYNEKVGLASQIDCVVKSDAGKYYILDWKTNKRIESNSYNKFMLDPFGHIPDSNYYHYSMQLGIYKRLCDYEIDGLYIVHIGTDNYDIIKADEDKASLDSIFGMGGFS